MRKVYVSLTVLALLPVSVDKRGDDGALDRFPLDEEHEITVEEDVVDDEGKPVLDAEGKPTTRRVVKKEVRPHPRGGLLTGERVLSHLVERPAIVTACFNAADGTPHHANLTVFLDGDNDANDRNGNRIEGCYRQSDGSLHAYSASYNPGGTKPNGFHVGFRTVEDADNAPLKL